MGICVPAPGRLDSPARGMVTLFAVHRSGRQWRTCPAIITNVTRCLCGGFDTTFLGSSDYREDHGIKRERRHTYHNHLSSMTYLTAVLWRFAARRSGGRDNTVATGRHHVAALSFIPNTASSPHAHHRALAASTCATSSTRSFLHGLRTLSFLVPFSNCHHLITIVAPRAPSRENWR